MYLRGVFLSTHLHNPCLCRRGHDLSNEDNIVWLWLFGIHGRVVAHIRKDITVVVSLYVLIVAIRSCLFEGAVPRRSPYGESLRRGIVVAYVAVVLVFDHPFAPNRGGFDHALVVEYDFVSLIGGFRGQRAGHCLSPVHLSRTLYTERCTVVSIVYSSSCSPLSFRPVCIPPCGGTFPRVVYGDPVEFPLVW